MIIQSKLQQKLRIILFLSKSQADMIPIVKRLIIYIVLQPLQLSLYIAWNIRRLILGQHKYVLIARWVLRYMTETHIKWLFNACKKGKHITGLPIVANQWPDVLAMRVRKTHKLTNFCKSYVHRSDSSDRNTNTFIKVLHVRSKYIYITRS